MLRSKACEKGIGLNFSSNDEMSHEELIRYMVTLHNMNDVSKRELLVKLHLEDKPTKMLSELITKLDVEHMVSNDASLLLEALGVYMREELCIYVTELIEFYNKHKRPAVFNDILGILYPNGFFDLTTVSKLYNFVLDKRSCCE